MLNRPKDKDMHRQQVKKRIFLRTGLFVSKELKRKCVANERPHKRSIKTSSRLNQLAAVACLRHSLSTLGRDSMPHVDVMVPVIRKERNEQQNASSS